MELLIDNTAIDGACRSNSMLIDRLSYCTWSL